MRRVIAAEKGEELEGDLAEPYKLFHEVTYAVHTWFDHRKHGGYPEMGGYNSQCPFLMADWSTLSLYHSRVEHGIFNSLYTPDNAPPIDSLMGG
jgi:hypothetical protein